MIEFADRVEAGRRLAERLEYLRGQDVGVLGLPRGGVPVASEVAQALDAPLDVIVVRKLGVPVQPELAMGAIGEGGARVLEAEVLQQTHVTEEQLRTVETRERALLEARVARLRSGRVARRAAGPGWATAWRGPGPHTADCGQRRPGCSRAEPLAQAQLHCPSELAVVEGATHLFEEPGTLAEAALLTSDWFARYLLPAGAARPAVGLG
jgi:Phosphoribosyl transferase domain